MKTLSPLVREFLEKGRSVNCPVIDAHGHMGPFHRLHINNPSPAAMVARMDVAGVAMTVFSHHAALMCPDVGNAPAIDAVRQFPGRLRAYCGINPNYHDRMIRDLGTFDDFSDVYVGLKFLADYHRVTLTDDRYAPAWEMADAKRLPVLVHTWQGSGFDGPREVEACAHKYPNSRVVAGHSFYADWEAAIEVAKSCPNVDLELTAVINERGPLEKLLDACGSEKIIFGTDFPWFGQQYCIGAVLGADMSDDDRHNILHRNAERVLGMRPGEL